MSDRPSVTLKLATSLDGRIATSAGESRWITGEAARAEVHRLRAAHDAVLIGIGTALADDPELTARTDPAPARQPLRVVLDRGLRLPASSKLAMTTNLGQVLVLGAGDGAALRAAGVFVEDHGAARAEGEIAAALRRLGEGFSIRSVLVEGGGRLAASFVREDLVDRLEWFRAPILLGGDARPALGDLGLDRLTDAWAFQRVALRELGPDLWESYERAARP